MMTGYGMGDEMQFLMGHRFVLCHCI